MLKRGANTVFGLKYSLEAVFQNGPVFDQIRYVKYRCQTPTFLSKTKYSIGANTVFCFGEVFDQILYLVFTKRALNFYSKFYETGQAFLQLLL